jgi:hypothetical protein
VIPCGQSNKPDAESQNASGNGVDLGRAKLPLCPNFILDYEDGAARQHRPTSQKLPPFLKQVTRKRNQPGKLVAGINVFFDDVKCEIIKPAETPHRQRQKHGGLQGRAVEEKQNDGCNTDEQKQQAF